MASRRKRKRERCQAAIGQDQRGDRNESQPSPPIFAEIATGVGGHHARGDLRLIAHAIREDWPMNDAKRAALMRYIMREMRDRASVRVVFAVAKCVIEADRADLRYLRRVLAGEVPPPQP